MFLPQMSSQSVQPLPSKGLGLGGPMMMPKPMPQAEGPMPGRKLGFFNKLGSKMKTPDFWNNLSSGIGQLKPQMQPRPQPAFQPSALGDRMMAANPNAQFGQMGMQRRAALSNWGL